MIRRVLMLTLVSVTVSACAPLHGPEVDLHAIATPDPVPQVTRPVLPLAPGPAPETGRWRAWVPRQLHPNGDVVEGHWLDISLTAPPVETIAPVKPMPRAPKTHLGAKSPASAQPQMPLPAVLPTPVLPSGLLPRPALGGQ